MAWYPGAVRKEIRPGTNDPPIIPIGFILHTDAGNSASLFNYFNGPSNGIESHFHIPKSRPVEQYRSTGYEADANLKANSFYVDGKRYGFISVETQGLAGDPWTDYQIAEIKKLLLWGRSVHPTIQLRVCPGPFSAGIGYHVLFGSPGPWTPVAKSCPGPLRIKQFNNVLVPWLRTATPPTGPKPTPPEDDMAISDAQMLELKKHITDSDKLYAIANNNYTRQVLSTATKAILAAGAAGDAAATKAIADLNAELDLRDAELAKDLDDVAAKVDALPKA